MRTVLTAGAVRAAERAAMAGGDTERDMIARAAKRVFDALDVFLGGLAGKRIVFACGMGNNGADGFEAALLARAAGARVDVVCPYPARSPEAAYSRERARDMIAPFEPDAWADTARPCPARSRETETPFEPGVHADAVCSCPTRSREAVSAFDPGARPDAWVDAMFGTGLSRPLDDACRTMFAAMEASGAPIVAVDLPSGLDPDTGRARDGTPRCALTVALGFLKPGLFLGDGPDLCGEIVESPLGFAVPEDRIDLIEPSDARAAFPVRKHNAHKNTYGHLLVLAGAPGMAGAAAICASAAVRAGAGLVTVACPAEIVPIVQTLVPEAMCLPLTGEDDEAQIASALAGKTAVAAGPGYKGGAGMLEIVMRSGLPAVLDAGALDPRLIPLLRGHHVITPHPGEAARLLGRVCDDPLRDARALSNFGCVALLKGATSVIAGAKLRLSGSGAPGMAKGGSGDALTGVIGALLARGIDPETAAWAGSEAHGLAGETAQAKFGDTSMTARDLIACLPEAIAKIRQ